MQNDFDKPYFLSIQLSCVPRAALGNEVDFNYKQV